MSVFGFDCCECVGFVATVDACGRFAFGVGMDFVYNLKAIWFQIYGFNNKSTIFLDVIFVDRTITSTSLNLAVDFDYNLQCY